jgi:ribosome-binding ATPase
MGIRAGIVGLPNVGKSTLFNALSSAGAEAANFPFCTIEPNVGVVPVPDPRLGVLADIYKSEQIIPTNLEIVDIAGLVKGASKGEGLGNQFLAAIREVDAILHVVRCFDDPNVVHVDGSVDPARDVEIIDIELALRDVESVQARLSRSSKMTKAGGKQGEEARWEVALLERLEKHLSGGGWVRQLDIEEKARPFVKELHLLTDKPVLFVGNIAEADLTQPERSAHFQKLQQLAATRRARVIPISAAIESEVAAMPPADRPAFLESLGLSEPGLHKVIRETYQLLGLITYLTAGPKETRAWTVKQGATAPEAAGVIHSDFERGFIRAEVMKYTDLASLKSETAVKGAGKLGVEGREYIVQDGDVMHFRFNV